MFLDSDPVVYDEATDKISNYLVTFEKLDKNIMEFQHVGKFEHSVAGFQFRIDRLRTLIFVRTFLPCKMFLIISFIAFFIPVHMIPGRMALLVTIFLMLVNIGNSEKTDGPNVNYKFHIFNDMY